MAFGVSAEYRMKTSTRRDFLNAAATAISGVVAGGAAPPSLATAAPYDADAMATEISAKLFADDGLARPIPETPTVSDLAKGSTAPWFLVAEGNIMSLGIVDSSMAFMS
jgi:Rieske Fe-S protein